MYTWFLHPKVQNYLLHVKLHNRRWSFNKGFVLTEAQLIVVPLQREKGLSDAFQDGRVRVACDNLHG